jgi:hypothetical protein
MTTKGLMNFKTVIVLLIIFILSSIAFLVVLRIDLFINKDLYAYGLQFNTLWANDYWYQKNMLLVFLSGTSALSVLSMIPHFDYSNQPTNNHIKMDRSITTYNIHNLYDIFNKHIFAY